MREVIRHHVKIGVDQIKLSMSGEEVHLPFFPFFWILAHKNRFSRHDQHRTATLLKMKPLHAWTKVCETCANTIQDQGLLFSQHTVTESG
jgi:hypothetical protein